MRITIATGPNYPVPPLIGGAMAKIWNQLAAEFAARGHEVSILARAHPGQPETEMISGVRYLRWGGYAQSTSIAWDLVRDLLYAVRAARRLPSGDIVVINDFWLPVFAARRPGCGRVVISVNRFPKGQMRLYSKAARLTACSQAVRDAIIAQCPAAADRTRVIPNPVDVVALRPPAGGRANRPANTILFVGRLHPEKGVHLLVAVFARLAAGRTGLRLRLVGPHAEGQGGGGENYLARLRALAGSAPVEFVGPVFGVEKLAAEYQRADVFCYPSLAEKGEAMGVAPLEAMATGLVPVVSGLECFRGFITDGKSGACFDHRANAEENLAAALVALLDNPVRRAEMGDVAHRVAQSLSYANVADQFLADFEELLRETPRTR